MNFDWARCVQVDLLVAKEFTKAAYENADADFAAFTDAGLTREVDFTSAGLGKRPMRWCLSALVISHLNNMIGEISVRRGFRERKGIRFRPSPSLSG